MKMKVKKKSSKQNQQNQTKNRFNFQFLQTFRGKFRQGWRVVVSETSEIVIYIKFANF